MEQRNLFLAIALSLLILIGSQMLMETLYPPPSPSQGVTQQAADGQPGAPGVPAGNPPQSPGGVAMPFVEPSAERAQKLQESPRVVIDTPRLTGSIAMLGGRIDDLVLRDYRVAVARDSENVVLLSPGGTRYGFYAQFGWVPSAGDTKVPGDDTLWQSSRSVLTPETPVTLTWDNGEGLRFSRTIAVDDDYMFTVADRVDAIDTAVATLFPYGLIGRDGTPPTSGFFILHEGPIAVADEVLEEVSYDTLQEDGQVAFEATGGWVGITDKYWLAGLIPDQSAPVKMRMLHSLVQGRDKYQTDFLGQAEVSVSPNRPAESIVRLFAGAKEVNLLDRYEERFGIASFDKAVDFGWFYFLTKPLFYFLDWLFGIVGNFGVAILIATLAIKLVFFPLANKSYQAMSRMKLLQPKMQELKEKYGDDRQKFQSEMMAVYKREKINPAAGCIPILIQIPVFFALYKVMFVSIEMRHAPFFGWVRDLSAMDPTNMFELFGLIPWGAPDFLHLGAWPLIMGATMFLQMRLNPQPTDPLQAKIFMFMPLIFTVFLASFPVGLVIYWAWNNTLSIGQQWIIMQRAAKKDAQEKAARKSGPVKPPRPPKNGKSAADGKAAPTGAAPTGADARPGTRPPAGETAAADETAAAGETATDETGADAGAQNAPPNAAASGSRSRGKSHPRRSGGRRSNRNRRR